MGKAVVAAARGSIAYPGVVAPVSEVWLLYIRRDAKKSTPKGKGRPKKGPAYLSIAHNVKEEGPKGKRTKPVVFANLGNEEAIDEKMARQLARSLDKYIDERWGSRGKKPTASEVQELAHEVRRTERTFQMLATKDLGMRLLLEAAWQDLGIGEALKDFTAKRRFEFEFERVVFAMVLNRLYDPLSKQACNEWVKHTGFMPEAEGWDVHQFYRAMDVLHQHWDELEGFLEARLSAGLAPEELKLRLLDTTSLYFEARHNDVELADLDARWKAWERDPDEKAKPPRRTAPVTVNEPAFRMQGHNKDGHPGDPQVVIASECVEAGYVLRHRTFAGNTNDSTIAKALVKELPPISDGQERVWVSDAGMMSKQLMTILDAAGWHRLSAEGPRKSVLGPLVLSEVKGRFSAHPDKPHLAYKSLVFESDMTKTGRTERVIASRNEKERERQLERLSKRKDAVMDELARQKPDEPHPRSTCKVASHTSQGRLVKASEKVTGNFVLNQEAIRKEELLAGVRFYRTTVLDWEPSQAHDAYQALQAVESNHRLMKGPLRLQPCYHRTTARIEAHVMLTILTANCVRYLERRSGASYQELVERFKRFKATLIDDGRRRYWQRMELDAAQTSILEKLGIPIPPRTWEKWIEVERGAAKSRNKGPSKRKGRSE